MALGRAALGGLAGGLVGAAVRAGIAYATHREIGWIAWGVGGLVGLGTRLLARDHDGPPYGFVAAGIAALALVGGKFATVALVVDDVRVPALTATDQDLVVQLADQVVEERAAKGKAVKFRPGMSVEKASKQADYPPDVWKEATKKWADLGPAGQAAKKAEHDAQAKEVVAAVRGAVRREGFKDSFTPFDLLWFGLAMFTAFRLGSGLTTDAD